MAGDTPSRKRRFRRKGAPEAYQHGQGPADGVTPAAEHSALLPRTGGSDDDGRGLPASLESAPRDHDGPATGRLSRVRRGIQKGGASARSALAHVADRIIDNAPRIPVRDLATLRRQFPGLGPEELADKLVAGAANSSSTVGAGIGAVTGHIQGGMSNDDLKELGTVLENGEAGLIVIYATNMADQVAASIKAENRYISDAIDADADELAKQLKGES